MYNLNNIMLLLSQNSELLNLVGFIYYNYNYLKINC